MTKPPLSGADKFWSDLTALDPGTVCRRAQVRYEAEGYLTNFMNGEYRVSPGTTMIEGPENHPPVNGGLTLLLLAYLVDCKDLEQGGRWISEKEVPGGSLFFTGPHKMPLDPLAIRYGKDPEAFVSRALKLGGRRLEFGDASVAFQALPRIPCAFVLWAEDDEFPAEVTVMFDETVSIHLPVDILLGLVGSVVKFLV